MSAEDFAFAINITDQMNWDLTEADFAFMLRLELGGCFVLLDGSEKVGIATTVSFGELGWFGNLIVQNDKRKKGGGSLLVNHALKYLTAKRVKSVGLYAYPSKIPFYTRLGFKYDSDFIVLKGKSTSSSVTTGVSEAGKGNLEKIFDFDKDCFGASRRKVLEPILLDSGNISYAILEGKQLLGFVAAKVYDKTAELGPLVCSPRRSDVAIRLISAVLGRLNGSEVSLCLHEREASILDALIKRGFSESFKVSRMFHGSYISKNCIYAAESLERG
jgi:GNAT superfamily N-acetyltransferase